MTIQGIEFVRPGWSAERPNLPYSFPVKEDLLSWHFFGDDIGLSIDNLVAGEPDATSVGTPDLDPYFATTKLGTSARYFDLGFVDPSEGSIAVVARSVTATGAPAVRPSYVASARSAQEGGVIIYASGETAVSLGTYIDDGVVALDQLAANGVDPTEWALWIGSWDGDGKQLYNMTTGQTWTKTHTGATHVVSPTNFWAGAGSTSYQGEGEIAHCSIAAKIWDVDERTAILTRLRAYYARRSITI